MKDRQPVQVWNQMFESSIDMKIIQTQKDAMEFKERANFKLPKGVTPMKQKFDQKQSDTSQVELPKLKFTKAKMEFVSRKCSSSGKLIGR